MNIANALDIGQKKECICFVGAGGKTTSMFRLAKELKTMGKRVVVTTTTKIFYPEEKLYDVICISRAHDEVLGFAERIDTPGIYVIGSIQLEQNKLEGLEPELLCRLYGLDNIDYVLAEADGAKQKTIKAPAAHEPVIPACTTSAVGVIGLDAIGMTADESTVHRLEEFCSVTGCRPGEEINTDHIISLVKHTKGLYKNVQSSIKKYVLLNKADNDIAQENARYIKAELKLDGNLKVLIGNVNSNDPVLE
ncbi:MAG: selenium cofactor biosynthesis protein YqeC [Bacillota bacterium]